MVILLPDLSQTEKQDFFNSFNFNMQRDFFLISDL